MNTISANKKDEGRRATKYRTPSVVTRILLFLVSLIYGLPSWSETLVVGGTGSGLELLRKVGNAYTQTHPGTQITVLPSIGSSGAIKGLVQKSLDIGLISRPLKDAEKSLPVQTTLCGHTPIVVTSSQTDERAMTTRRLVDIYSGTSKTWGNGSPIRLILRPASETDTQVIGELSDDLKQAVQMALQREGMVVATTDQEAANALQRTPGSLGTTTLALILSESRPLLPMTLNGIAPLVSGKPNPVYPLRKSLYLAIRTDSSPTVRDFVQFVLRDGRAILDANGYFYAPQ